MTVLSSAISVHVVLHGGTITVSFKIGGRPISLLLITEHFVRQSCLLSFDPDNRFTDDIPTDISDTIVR